MGVVLVVFIEELCQCGDEKTKEIETMLAVTDLWNEIEIDGETRLHREEC